MNSDVLKGAALSIIKVLPNTLYMAAVIMLSGIFFGTVIALLRQKGSRPLNRLFDLALAYVRGTPLVVQMLLVYYSLPRILVFVGNSLFSLNLQGYDIPSKPSVYVSFIFCVSFVQSENIRAALKSVETGQWEAAWADGLTSFQAFMRIIAPQALTVAVPGFLSFYMSVIKMLSLAFMLEVVDIIAAAKLYATRVSIYTECYVMAALIYWILSIVFTFLAKKLEKKLQQKQGRGVKNEILQKRRITEKLGQIA